LSGHHDEAAPLAPVAARVAALEALLVERQVIDLDSVEAIMQGMAESFGSGLPRTPAQ
jgi:hypothetical protein